MDRVMGTRQRPSRGAVAAGVLAVVTMLCAAGCSDDAGDAATGEQTPSASPSTSTGSTSTGSSAAPSTEASPEAGTILAVTVRGDTVEPRGKRVQVAAGEPLTLAIDSDTEGELHVHATPETEFPFGPGTSRKQIVLDQPGVVEVELHEPTEVTVFQLEVR